MVRFWPKVLPTFGGLLWWQSRLGWIDNVFRPCPELRRWNRKQSINRPKESVHYSHLSLSGGSQMSLTDGVLWFAETGLEWLGTPTVIEAVQHRVSQCLDRGWQEGPFNPFENGTTGHLTYSKTPVTMPAWAYGIYSTSTCSWPTR